MFVFLLLNRKRNPQRESRAKEIIERRNTAVIDITAKIEAIEESRETPKLSTERKILVPNQKTRYSFIYHNYYYKFIIIIIIIIIIIE